MEPEYPEEDEQVFSSVERPVGAAFFFPGALDGPAPAWLADKIDRAGLAPVDSGEDGLVAVGWAGLRCEAHVLALDEFTVLVLVFGWLDLLEARVESATPDTDGVPPPPPDATPLARAFLDTCTRLDLGADLAVAVVQGEPVPNLFGQFARSEEAVLTLDTRELLTSGYQLLYLSAEHDLDTDLFIGARRRDELPTSTGGRLLFAGTGWRRWHG